MYNQIWHHSSYVLMVLLFANAASAFTPPPGDDDGEIVVCYYTRAIVVGLTKCDPPSTLLGAVYGGCSNMEDAIRQKVLNGPSDGTGPVDREEIAQIAINSIHSKLASRIQGWVLDAQADANSACHARPNRLK
jgi:hypothetical protein